MSGFVAVVNTDGRPVERALLETLTGSLHFRGPDRQQVWAEGAVGLGHALFRTTDEARHENQPASLDGKVWVTGCIRIDAREELLHKLGLQHDVRLADTPDSHLLLMAYRAWGEHCLEHVLGDFSFALWDSGERKLFCARDHFGLRQLCYARRGHTLIVSNSINCLRQHPAVSDRLCKTAIGDFLLFGDHRWGDRSLTAFADIRMLEPAHSLVLKGSELRTRRYWSIATGTPLIRYRTESEYLEHFEQVFKAAVSDRLRTDRVVIALSGGMDSSSIAAVIRALQKSGAQSLDVQAVTSLFDSMHDNDERYYVEQVSRCLDLAPRYCDGGRYPLLAPYVQTTHPLELYQPQLSLDMDRYDAERGRVLLTGDGGDELLASSSIRQALDSMSAMAVLREAYRLRALYGAAPNLGTGLMVLKGRIFSRGSDASLPYPYPEWINPDFERELELRQRWSQLWSKWRTTAVLPRTRHPHIARALLTPDWNTDDYYMDSGCALMEQRCPLLDTRLVALVMALPALPWLFKKHLLRRTMGGRLPPDVLRRRKTPLGDIHASLLRNNRLETIGSSAEVERYIAPRWLETLPADAGNATESYVNLRPLLLQRWLEALGER